MHRQRIFVLAVPSLEIMRELFRFREILFGAYTRVALHTYTLIVLKTLDAVNGVLEGSKQSTYPNPEPPVAITVPGICGCQWASLICSI